MHLSVACNRPVEVSHVSWHGAWSAIPEKHALGAHVEAGCSKKVNKHSGVVNAVPTALYRSSMQARLELLEGLLHPQILLDGRAL
jgi:hypothetical protein